ncbi:MAG: histidinol dehydrogenase [Bacteroidetes bacterium]|nr:MAG: histidinol dehydrogenase [Bacteroidota bacterium]
MKIYQNPDRNQWAEILARPTSDAARIEADVARILEQVKAEGDAALRALTKKFDGADLTRFDVSDEELAAAETLISDELKQAIQTAWRNIHAFHAAQRPDAIHKIETMPGVWCWRKNVPVERVGLYVPGGSAPLFSTVLMLATPARIAGCREVILATPPDADGRIHPAILYAARLTGVTKIFKMGGAQAIAALAFGTASVPAVHKIFGPGNQYVTTAKMLVNKTGIPIDMPAGPSEVLVVADAFADPDFVAADLLAQAEHGPDSQVVLVACSAEKVSEILHAVEVQCTRLPRADIARRALENSVAIVVESPEKALEISNFYAPEHLIIATRNADQLAEKVENAGSVFIGDFSPESVGDYASGTNHTLPTNGAARAYSGVSLDSFVKKITFQKLTESGLRNIGPTVEIMAAAEALDAHRIAVSIRLEKLRKPEL